MLLQFNFENFHSFKENASLDFSATRMTEHSEHVVKVGREKILPVASIFGANASGKSNVYLAFKCMYRYVLRSFSYGGDSDDKSLNTFVRPTPYLLNSKSKDAESSFEVYFIDSEENGAKTYNYGFTIDNNGVKEEWLNYKAKTVREYKEIFYRNRDKEIIRLEGLPKAIRNNIKVSLEKEALIVSLGAKLKIKKLKFIRDWFMKNEIANFGEPLETFFRSTTTPENFARDEKVQQKVVEYFSSFDKSIVGFNVEKIKENNNEKNKENSLKIDALHKMNDSDETVAIPLKLESAGTLKMFAMYPLVEKVLESGGVLFIDELNGRLHPLLVRIFVQLFLDKEKNKNNAQLIFTTHDVWQLDSGLFRRDEIWFIEKALDGASELFSLADFKDDQGGKIRKDESYEKNYLLGKYGAIPNLKSFDLLKEGEL